MTRERTNQVREQQIRSSGILFELDDALTDFCTLVESKISFEGLDVLEVGCYLPKSFVLDVLKVNSWTSIEEPDSAVSLQHKRKKNRTIRSFSDYYLRDSKKYLQIIDRLANFPTYLYEQFDLVFSTSTMQHILHFGEVLFKMYRMLRTEGRLMAHIGPIWTSPHGHMLRPVVDNIGREVSMSKPIDLIPPWSHLIWSPPEFYVQMCKRMDRQTASEVVYQIFNSKNINRLFPIKQFRTFEAPE